MAKYAEGTLAKIHWGEDEEVSAAFAEWRDGEWRYANGLGSYEFSNLVTKVEVLNVPSVTERELSIQKQLADAYKWANEQAYGYRLTEMQAKDKVISILSEYVEQLKEALDERTEGGPDCLHP